MKKIEVKTKCGETFTLEVDTNQEIESMEVVEERRPYRLEDQEDGHWHMLGPDGLIAVNIYLKTGRIATLQSGGGNKIEIERC